MKKAHLVICFILSFSFLQAQDFDINTLRDINLNRNKNLDATFKEITNSAAPISVAIPLVIFSAGLIKKDKEVQKKAIFIGESFIANAIVTIALKKAIKRDRPFTTYPEIEKLSYGGSDSFPSGHTSASFSTATSLSMAFPKWYVIAPSFAWASTVGYSRMHLGVHYPTDVLSGAIIGSGTAFLSYKINKWINKKQQKPVMFDGNNYVIKDSIK